MLVNKGMVGGVFLAALAFCAPSLAVETTGEPQQNFAPIFGPTLPPIGYVQFCAASPSECKQKTVLAGALDLTPERWRDVYQVNTLVNAKIRPVSDMELYGRAEVWTLPRDAGDCEDYLLLKKKYLEAIGFPASALLITVVLDERKEGHAVLTIASRDGDFVLDNRRNDILRWNTTGYTFLKRQSHDNPRKWVALMGQPPVATAEISATPSP
jgi:predicted transglutaminase-like cysteine proteinase